MRHLTPSASPETQSRNLDMQMTQISVQCFLKLVVSSRKVQTSNVTTSRKKRIVSRLHPDKQWEFEI